MTMHSFNYSVGRTPDEFIRYLADYAHTLAQTGRSSAGRLDDRNPDIELALNRWLGLEVGSSMRCDAAGRGVLERVSVTGALPQDGYLEVSLALRLDRTGSRSVTSSFGLSTSELERLAALAEHVEADPCAADAECLALEHLEESYGLRRDQLFREVYGDEPFVLMSARPVALSGFSRARLGLELEVLSLKGDPRPTRRLAQPLGDAFEVLS